MDETHPLDVAYPGGQVPRSVIALDVEHRQKIAAARAAGFKREIEAQKIAAIDAEANAALRRIEAELIAGADADREQRIGEVLEAATFRPNIPPYESAADREQRHAEDAAAVRHQQRTALVIREIAESESADEIVDYFVDAQLSRNRDREEFTGKAARRRLRALDAAYQQRHPNEKTSPFQAAASKLDTWFEDWSATHKGPSARRSDLEAAHATRVAQIRNDMKTWSRHIFGSERPGEGRPERDGTVAPAAEPPASGVQMGRAFAAKAR